MIVIAAGPHEAALHTTRISALFLVRHGELGYQPYCLLHHERQVCIETRECSNIY